MQNYTRLTTVYLPEMSALKDTDSSIWNYFDKGHFCMNKSIVCHSGISFELIMLLSMKTVL